MNSSRLSRVFRLFVLLFLGSATLISATAETPDAARPESVVVGYDNTDGLLLVNELNCQACHQAEPIAGYPPKQAPVLTDVGSRVTPQYLRAFLAEPHAVKPGTPMPDLLHAAGKDREETVEALVHHLVSLGGPIEQRGRGASEFQIERGKALFHSIGCVACHEPQAPPPPLPEAGDTPAIVEEGVQVAVDEAPRPSAPLGPLAKKTTVDGLAAFLSDPLKVRPSGRMPHMKLAAGEANLLAAYLLRDQLSPDETGLGVGLDFAYYEGNWQKVPDFDTLAAKVEGAAKAFDLAAIALPGGKKLQSNFAVRFRGIIDLPEDGNYRFWTKSDDGSVLRIDGNLVVDNDGIHAPQERGGEAQLIKGRHAIEVGLVQGGGGFELSVDWQPPGAKDRGPIPPGVLYHSARAMIPVGIADFKVDAQKAARGRELFGKLGCANCHQTEKDGAPADIEKIQANELAKVDPTKPGGCLSDKVAPGRPKFFLSNVQREALQKAVRNLAKPAGELKPNELVHRTMNAMKCYACHGRNDVGGPTQKRQAYFTTTTVVDLGDEGRIPPALNDVGDKLTPHGFDLLLFEGETVRPHMATRMPQFGKANIGQLPKLLAEADAGKIQSHEPQFSSRLVDDGRRLVGKKALGCINCHAWAGRRLQGADGLDLVDMPKRLTPGWFHALLENPQTVKPRTRMPTAWPNGKSFFPDIQGGDPDRQMDAIWAYLSVGEKGGMPLGLSPDDEYILVPDEEPIVFRTFLQDVGAHAIAVGYRQRTHFAFDALGVRMAKAWAGSFLSARPAWEGRAGQYAQIPGASIVTLPAAPAMTILESQADAWPAFDRKQKAAPEGYRFIGYRYDEKRVPTFLYRYGKIEVEEIATTDYRQDGAYLVRRMWLKAPAPVEKLYLRAATGGKIVQEKDGSFIVGETSSVRYHVEGSPDVKPLVRESGGQELLIPIQFARSGGKDYEAKLTLEMLW